MSGCYICPRECGALRNNENPGVCGADLPPGFFRVGKVMQHFGEEPFISGSKGSGTIFFSGCALGCRFCQNYKISHRQSGTVFSFEDLQHKIGLLIQNGVHNLNWVTASHYVTDLIPMFKNIRQQFPGLPMIWNTGSYEKYTSLKSLQGLIDVYLPDFKFHDVSMSQAMADAANYRQIATQAIHEMLRQQPRVVFDETGMIQKGVAIRHLVLPGHLKDSLAVLEHLAHEFPLDLPLSIMQQYTPFTDLSDRYLDHIELKRKVTTYEYNKVVEHADRLGFASVLTQERSSASAVWTPEF